MSISTHGNIDLNFLVKKNLNFKGGGGGVLCVLCCMCVIILYSALCKLLRNSQYSLQLFFTVKTFSIRFYTKKLSCASYCLCHFGDTILHNCGKL